MLAADRLILASAASRSLVKRMMGVAAVVLFVVAWIPAIYASRLQLPRHHAVHAPHRLLQGRAAMLRHAAHYASFADNSTVYKVGMVADMDRVSKINVAKNSAWMSIFKTLLLRRNELDGSYGVEWLEEVPVVSRLSEADRGMELSELLYFHNKLLSFSDRTGVIYEIQDLKLVPLWILSDFDGNSEDGFKSEWATVKDGKQRERRQEKSCFFDLNSLDVLYVGSTGKPWQSEEGGKVLNTNRQWVKRVTLEGKIEHVSWVHIYDKLLNFTQSNFAIHEAVNWNPLDRRWYFLPRRMSKETWSKKTDSVGSCVIISCSESFEDWKVTQLGKYQVGHGYSSFKFVPYREHEIIALKTEEYGDDVHTDLEVIDIVKGKILLHVRLGLIKFEGIELVK